MPRELEHELCLRAHPRKESIDLADEIPIAFPAPLARLHLALALLPLALLRLALLPLALLPLALLRLARTRRRGGSPRRCGGAEGGRLVSTADVSAELGARVDEKDSLRVSSRAEVCDRVLRPIAESATERVARAFSTWGRGGVGGGGVREGGG